MITHKGKILLLSRKLWFKETAVVNWAEKERFPGLFWSPASHSNNPSDPYDTLGDCVFGDYMECAYNTNDYNITIIERKG